MQNKKGVRLVSAKKEINQINDKGEKEKLPTNKIEKNKSKSNYTYKPKQRKNAKINPI